MKIYYFKEDVRNVTETYYDIILNSLRRNGYTVIAIETCTWKSVRIIKKEDYILATRLGRFWLLYYLCGFRNFIFWFQGITPEEVYMIYHKKWMYWIFSFLEKLAIKTSKYKISVSKYIFKHFENKYKINLDYNKLFIMPCFNSEFNSASFLTNNKYKKNTFCYAGGLQVWQGFEDILNIYKKIEEKYNNTFFKIYSKELDKAKSIVKQSGIKNYSIECVPKEKMQEALSDCKFGFIIRENNTVNNVATPTKLGTYIGNGVIPIMNKTIYAFNDMCDSYQYIINTNLDDPCSKIESYLDDIDQQKIYNEFKQFYDTFYNKEKYIKELQNYLIIE